MAEISNNPVLNIAEKLNRNKKGREILVKMGNVVVEDYKTDLGSRSGLDKRLKIWFKLFSGISDPKTHPWPGSSNVVLPIISIACHQSHARLYDALIPSTEILKCVATDGAAVNVAKRRQRYLNWQVNTQMPEWKPDMDKLLLLNPIYGTAVKKTYYDQTLKRVVSRTIRLDEFVAPYGVRDLSDAPRKTHVLKMWVNDVKIKGKRGIWINTEDINVDNTSVIVEEPSSDLTDEKDKATGVARGTDTKDTRRVILEQHRLWDLNDDGIEEPYCVTVDLSTSKVLSLQTLTYIDQESEEKVYDYFTPYNFISNPDSWMGLGFGSILEHITRSINSITNQLIDAGTLANTSSGFINKTRNLKIGKLKIKMGQFTEVDLGSDDLRKSIFPLKFSEPSNVLFALLGMLQDYAQKVSSTPDSMLGQMPPSDTAATSLLAIMEQGMKVQSTIHRRQHYSLGQEAEKISTLNALYMNEETYLMVQDSESEEMQEENISGREDFLQTIDTVPVSDPSITSRAEKLIKSQRAWELLNAEADPEEKYELKKNLLDSMGVQNIDKILKKPEPPPEPPDLRPEEEEAEFLAERGMEPLETQDHEYHLVSHQVFKETMADQPKDGLIELSPQGKKLLEAHIKETMSLLYLQQESE